MRNRKGRKGEAQEQVSLKMIFIINYSFLLLYIHYIKSVLPIFISTELYRQYYVQEDRSFMKDSEVYEEIQPILLQQQLDYYQFLYDYHHPHPQGYQTKLTLTESGSKTQMTFPYSEYLALEFLYNSTNGPYWRWFNFTWTDSNITNYIQHQIHLPFHIFNFTVGSIPWNFTKYGENNPCTDNWQGIICSCTPTTCHVTQLDLDQHNISGVLPLQFGDLTELIALSFRKNNISGMLPATMGQMKNLILLNLESNSFTGGLENWFGNFTNLLLVGVSINFFNSLSSGFYSLKQLLFLDLGINNFYGPLPTQFGNYFPLLRETLIFGNSFSGRIPESMINLTQLRLFDADFNDFTGPFPTVFCSLVNMTALSIGTNHFTGTIPENITNLILLQRLFLASNQFFGTIPQMIGQLNQLLFFNVDKNILSGSLPDSFSELKRLNVILLYENSFTGTISSNNFPIESTSINYLYLQYNHFHGEVEEVFNHAPTLIFFVLTSNMFSGPLPNVNSKLLYEYFAGKNCFTGTISPRFANLTSLRFFYSGSNYLHGSLPSTFITSIFIANINVSTNLLTGTLPPSLGKLVNMDQLFFDHNFFTGTAPSSYGDLKQLVVLSLANNDLVGSIPSSYGGFTVLQEIFLEHNRFTGNIADVMRLFNQRFIVNVDLTDNQFTGTLAPSYFTNNTQTLQTFSASLNCLSGSIPTEICSVNSLNALSLDGLTTAENCRSYIFPALSQMVSTFVSLRSLRQTIPDCFFTMKSLTSLHLSGNGLTGTLPKNLTISKNLTDLSLSHNSLSGEIPTNFQEKYWINFDLSYNKLTGTLMKEFSVMPTNGSLYLEVNRLSGVIPSNVLPIHTISILNGNLFDCDNANIQNQIPQSDPQAQAYNCGSNAADYAMYAWTAITGFSVGILILIILTLRKVFIPPSPSPASSTIRKSERKSGKYTNSEGNVKRTDSSSSENQRRRTRVSLWGQFVGTYQLLALWRQTFSQRPKSSNLYFLQIYFLQVRWLFIKVTLFTLLILLPLYGGLTIHYSSFTYQYAWTISGILLTGQLPVIFMDIFFAIFIFWLVYLLRQLLGLIENHRLLHQGRYSMVLQSLQLNQYDRFIYGIIGIVDILVMGVIDVAYVFVALNAASDVIITTALGLAMIRIFINNLLLWNFLPFCRYQISWQQQKTHEKELENEKKELMELAERRKQQQQPDEQPGDLENFPRGIEAESMQRMQTIIPDQEAKNPLHHSTFSRATTAAMTGPSQASEAIDGTNTRRSQFQWYFDVPSLWRPTFNNANQNKRTSADNGGPRTMSQSSMSSWLSVSYSLSPTARFIASYQFTTSDIRFLETIMLLNNIILPILAILFVSSDCFYNVLFQAPTVTSSYNYVTCPRYFFNGLVAAYCSTATETTTYSPPFFYRYQCSSEIVINYVPVYIWMFLFVGIVLPLTKVVLKLLYDYLTPMYRAAKKKEKIALAKSPPPTTLKSPKKEGATEPAVKTTVKIPRSYSTSCLFHTYYLLEMILPDSLQKLTPKSPLESKTDPSNPTTVAILNDEQPSLEHGRERASTLPAPPALAAPSAITAASGFLFKKLKLGVQINSYLTVMISFGVLFPPLAVIACVTVISVTYFEEHTIGRLLYLSKEYGYHWYEERLEQESDGAADSLVLSSQSMVTVACGLYAYIVFDTWGDQEGWYSALAPSLLMGCIPVIVYLVDYHLQRKKKLTLKARLQSIEELFHIQLSERSNLRITTTTNPSEYSPSEVSRNNQSRVKIPDVVIPDSEMELGEKKIEEPEENSKVTEQDEEEKEEEGNGEEDSEDEKEE